MRHGRTSLECADFNGMVTQKRFVLFLQFPCGYESGDASGIPESLSSSNRGRYASAAFSGMVSRKRYTMFLRCRCASGFGRCSPMAGEGVGEPQLADYSEQTFPLIGDATFWTADTKRYALFLRYPYGSV